MTESRKWQVDEAQVGSRLDRYVSTVAAVPRTVAQRAIASGHVTVNGAAAKPATILAAGDHVVAVLGPPPGAEDAAPAPAHFELDIVAADDTFIVVNKPSGLVVHPAAGHADDTLVNALVARFPDLVTAFAGARPGIVHRLDRDTSGLLVVARTPEAHTALVAQFKARAVEKTYLSAVWGVPDPPEAVIDAPIGRNPRERKRMAAVPGGKPATTRYRVLGSTGEVSLLEVHPATGRTHQIRVHLALIECPVVGDRVYGRRGYRAPGPGRELLGPPRLMLHAWKLAFSHPRSGHRRAFSAPVPEDMRAWLAARGLPVPGEAP